MTLDHENPILARSPAYEELGPIPRSTSSAEAKPKKCSPAIQRLIGELGLRFRPSATADLEAHAASLALLCTDLADVPPHLLERAIADHVRMSRFMPKAAELIELARSYVGRRAGPSNEVWQRRMDEGNAMLVAAGLNEAMRWVMNEGGNGIHLEGSRA